MKFAAAATTLALLIALTGFSYSQDTTRTGRHSPRHFTLHECVNEFTPARVESTKAGYQYWFVDTNFVDGAHAQDERGQAALCHASSAPPCRRRVLLHSRGDC